MWLSPRVAGELSCSAQFLVSIQVVSSSSITPLSWKLRMASDILFVQGDPCIRIKSQESWLKHTATGQDENIK